MTLRLASLTNDRATPPRAEPRPQGAVSCVLIALCLLAAPARAADADPEKEIKRLVDVFSILESEAADPISSESVLYQGAIPGMLRTLDPHSIFFDPGQFQQLQQMQRSEQKGFGMIVSVLPGRVIVLQTMEGTPSAKAGLSGGDEILAINNIALSRLEPEELIQFMGQARQHEVSLDVRRPGNARLLRFALTPALVDTPTVDRAFLLGPGVGFLRLTAFEGPTGKLVKETIEKLGGTGLKGLVIDLRGNPGGDVKSAVDMASLFLEPDQLIFTVKGRSAGGEEVRVKKLNRPYTFPVSVLVDAKSASASEIFSGAMQDHDRAAILGESTYGKGLVQRVYPLSSGSGLALTTAFYYTPSGRSIQKRLEGVELSAATTMAEGPFKTDKGRLVLGGGGIRPDEIVLPENPSRLRAVLDATSSFTSFATEVLHTPDIPENFEVPGTMLDQFKVFLSEHNIQPSLSDWLKDREWIQSRLKQDLLNLKFGVAVGDQVEFKRDPVVNAAVKHLK
jgi:carboxyl-terminal processing protease